MGDSDKNEYCGYSQQFLDIDMRRYLLNNLQLQGKKWTLMESMGFSALLWLSWLSKAEPDELSLKILATYHSCTFHYRRTFVVLVYLSRAASLPPVQVLAAACKKRTTDRSGHVSRAPFFNLYLSFRTLSLCTHTNSNICFAFRLNTPWNVR